MSKGNLNIAGNATIPEGEYNCIKVMGNAKTEGNVTAEELTVSGNAEITNDLEAGKVVIHGNATVKGCLRADYIKVNGNLKVEGGIEAGTLIVNGDGYVKESSRCKEASIKGDLHVDSLFNAMELKIYGNLYSGSDLTGENIVIRGKIRCDGLLNAENITVYSYTKSYCKEIGASNVSIIRPNFFARLFSFGQDTFHGDQIEGDSLSLEKVAFQTVRGKSVKIAKHSKVDKVEYTKEIFISKDSEVGSTEKVGDE